MLKEIVIVAAKRTPLGQFNGQLSAVAAPQLGAAALSAAQAAAGIASTAIEAVLMGCVLPAGLGQAPARQAALSANLSEQTACTTLNKMCGSGMQAVMMACDAIEAGTHHVVAAGGMESMSRAPYLLSGQARQGLRFGHQTLLDHLLHDGLEDAYQPNCLMGTLAEAYAKAYQISRAMQDSYALQSLERARTAIKAGYLTQQMAPITIHNTKQDIVITEDEGPFKVNPQKIPLLPPIFSPEGTITAASSSSMADGAAALILTDIQTAEAHSLKPLARIVGHSSFAAKPADFPSAPIHAIRRLLHQIHWQTPMVDLWEINEAFAVVPLVCSQALELDHQRVNVDGGACVLGHPLGASGARIIVSLLHSLQIRGQRRGIAAICIGGGEATALAIEMRL